MNLLDCLCPIDAMHHTARGVVIQQRWQLFEEDIHAPSCYLRRVVTAMADLTTLDSAFDHDLARHGEIERRLDSSATAFQPLVERARLSKRPWKPIQHRAVLGIRLREAC
jgi:hypothetical protein